MENYNKKRKLIFQCIAFGVLLVALLVYISTILKGIGWIFDVSMPLIIGAAIAFVLAIPVDWFEKKLLTKERMRGKLSKWRRPLAIILTLLCFALVIFFVLIMVIPQLVSSFQLLLKELPGALQEIDQWLSGIPALSGASGQITTTASQLENLVTGYVKNGLGQTIGSAVQATVGIVSSSMTFLFGLLFSLYILASKERLARHFRELSLSLFSKDTSMRIFYLCHLTSDNFRLFISSQVLEAFILFGMYVVVAAIFRLPYSMMTAVLIGVFSLIPLFGAYIAWGIASFLLLTVNPWDVLTFTVIFVIISQIEGNFIYPHIVGKSMGIPGIWVFAAVLVGGNMWGLVGMIVSVPIASILYTLLVMWKDKTLKEKHIEPSEYMKSPDWKTYDAQQEFLDD